MGPPQATSIFLSFLAVSLCSFLSISCISLSAAAPSSSIYDALRANGLPVGLLPKGVQNFSLDVTTGRFEARLDQACNARFENQVHYDFTVAGTLSFGRIAALSGVAAQELFLWFPVNSISVDVPSSGLIYFDVGVIHKQFSLSLFETPPECLADEVPDLLFQDGRIVSWPESESQSTKLGNELTQQLGLRAVS